MFFPMTLLCFAIFSGQIVIILALRLLPYIALWITLYSLTIALRSLIVALPSLPVALHSLIIALHSLNAALL